MSEVQRKKAILQAIESALARRRSPPAVLPPAQEPPSAPGSPVTVENHLPSDISLSLKGMEDIPQRIADQVLFLQRFEDLAGRLTQVFARREHHHSWLDIHDPPDFQEMLRGALDEFSALVAPRAHRHQWDDVEGAPDFKGMLREALDQFSRTVAPRNHRHDVTEIDNLPQPIEPPPLPDTMPPSPHGLLDHYLAEGDGKPGHVLQIVSPEHYGFAPVQWDAIEGKPPQREGAVRYRGGGVGGMKMVDGGDVELDEVRVIEVPTGALVDEGDNRARLNISGGVPLTIKDAGVTVSDVTTVVFDDITDNGGGQVTVSGGGGGASALDDLTDVTITAPAEGQLLRRGAAGWTNAALQAADIPDLSATYVTDAYTDLADNSKIGAGGTQVAAGDHTHTSLPTSDEKAALAGTGTPAAGDPYVNDSDSRLSRIPGATGTTGHVWTKTALGADWQALAGGGDMNRATYDTDEDGKIDLAAGGTESDLSATGPGFLKQGSAGAAVSVAALQAADIPDLSATYVTDAYTDLADNSKIGAGGTQVAAGDHTHTTLPTSDEKAALAGTGTPAAGNPYVTQDAAATTPTADKWLKADGSGKIADGWLSANVPLKDATSVVFQPSADGTLVLVVQTSDGLTDVFAVDTTNTKVTINGDLYVHGTVYAEDLSATLP